MRTYNIALFLTLFGFLLLTSCVDEDLVKKGNEIKEGIPVSLRLPFAPDEPIKIETKAGEASTNIDDLYVLIFDKNGNRLRGEHGGGYVSLTPGSNSITLLTTSGIRYIYGVANLTTSTLAITQNMLDGISNVEALKNYSMSLQQEGINETTGKFLMSGFCTLKGDNELDDAPLCAISEKGDLTTVSGTETPVLKLKRLQSRIKFNVTTGGRTTGFILTSFSVMNIPTGTTLYEDNRVMNTTSSGWFSSENNKTLDGGSRSFSFYMLENKQQKQGGAFPSGSNNEVYKYRADESYAPAKGTYIVLKGAYEGTEDKYENGVVVSKGQPVQASVVYYIYLGYVGNVIDDYSSKRNKDYTYHVKVNGVNSIIVEAETAKEDPSAGGDVYYETGGAIFSVDAHYASKVLKFKKSELAKDNAADNIIIKVSSHKTTGFENRDTEWLTFIEGGSIDGNKERPVRFPGTGKVMTAKEFTARLKEIAKDGSIVESAEFYFTCFINENYPIVDVDAESSWSSFVNTPYDRMAQIICRAKKNHDSQTIDAAYLIRQKPIYTFFSGGNQPWGVESINETTNYSDKIEIGLPYGGSGSNGTDQYNGRANMITELGNSVVTFWYEDQYVPNANTTPGYKDFVSSFKTAYAACMQRNRDEDGDGRISDNEVKWYLPAIFQYTDMSIGANALPKTVQLYSDDDYAASKSVNNKIRWRFKHYVSNSGKQIYWGEEGGPYGGHGGDNGWNSAWQQAMNPYTYHIRCVRNLGENSLVSTIAPSPVAFKNGDLMDLSNMSSDALRSNRVSGSELGTHSERDLASLPYVGSFRVAQNFCRQPDGYTYAGTARGSYALSDRNGYYYTIAASDGVTYTEGSRNSQAFVNKGPYNRDKDKNMTWVGANKGNAMYSDKNGYYWSSTYHDPSNPRGSWSRTTPETYVFVGAGKGIYSPNGEWTNAFDWSYVNIAIDKGEKSPCSTYSESSDKSDVGTWRLPNMRELLLMVSHGGYTGTALISRTYYSFYLNDILHNGKVQQADGQLDGYTKYSPMDGLSREGFVYDALVYLMNPGNRSVYIRCVKDN